MKLAHVAIATPGRCGLYETTRDLVEAERELGVDARIVDPKPHATLSPGKIDRGVPLASMKWAVTADLIVSHSGHDGTPLEHTDQPIVVAAHGRPVSTWIMEREGGAPAYSYHAKRSRLDRYRACVTFWPEYAPIFQGLWGDKPVHVVPSMVNLDYWNPGKTGYDFAGRGDEINVVMTDPWSRVDSNLLPVVHAFELFRHHAKGARLHIYALDSNERGMQALKMMLGDSLGVVQGWASDLRSVYRSADMLITPHRIYTRAIREAMACGLAVVSGRDHDPEDTVGFAAKMMDEYAFGRDPRSLAEAWFDPSVAATKMIEVARQHARQEASA